MPLASLGSRMKRIVTAAVAALTLSVLASTAHTHAAPARNDDASVDNAVRRSVSRSTPLFTAWVQCSARAFDAFVSSSTPVDVLATAALGKCKNEELELQATIAEDLGRDAAARIVENQRERLWSEMVYAASKVRAKRKDPAKQQ